MAFRNCANNAWVRRRSDFFGKFAGMHDYSATLSKYMPAAAAPAISRWINETGVQFRISRSRSSKLGDYAAPFGNKGHRISVNHDLNPYAFLTTTVHEFAHLRTWEKYRNKVKPHGAEWKREFQALMAPFIADGVFPEDIQDAITRYLANPAASSCTDATLSRALRKYDKTEYATHTVETLPLHTHFALKNGRIFRKGEKVRKRYKCLELKTQRLYLFSPVAEVIPINTGQ